MILKMDIEAYECKALPKEIIMGSSGKWIPFIFLQLVSFHWQSNCPQSCIYTSVPQNSILLFCLSIFTDTGCFLESWWNIHPGTDRSSFWDLSWVWGVEGIILPSWLHTTQPRSLLLWFTNWWQASQFPIDIDNFIIIISMRGLPASVKDNALAGTAPQLPPPFNMQMLQMHSALTKVFLPFKICAPHEIKIVVIF